MSIFCFRVSTINYISPYRIPPPPDELSLVLYGREQIVKLSYLPTNFSIIVTCFSQKVKKSSAAKLVFIKPQESPK